MLLSLLFGRRRRAHRADLHFVLYTRRGCHLCETAHEVLNAARKRHGCTLELIDVDTSPDLVERYGNCVPVVTVNGQVRFRGMVNPVLLQRVIDAGS